MFKKKYFNFFLIYLYKLIIKLHLKNVSKYYFILLLI